MANIFKSSIGKKLIMSVTGICLILFLTFHMVMNLTYVFDPDEVVYKTICEILSMGWVNVVVPILAAFFVIHILYAFILTISNRQARGVQRYEIPNKAKTDSWSARNMFVLGLIVLCGIALHLINFWSKMQLAEIKGGAPVDGIDQIKFIFANNYFSVMYLLWLVAIWFHLSHGIASVMQSIGWSNHVWQRRIEFLGNFFATIIVLMFASVVIYYWIII